MHKSHHLDATDFISTGLQRQVVSVCPLLAIDSNWLHKQPIIINECDRFYVEVAPRQAIQQQCTIQPSLQHVQNAATSEIIQKVINNYAR